MTMKTLFLRLVVYLVLSAASLVGLIANIVVLVNGNGGMTFGQVLVFTLAFLAVFVIAVHQGIVTAFKIKNAPKNE